LVGKINSNLGIAKKNARFFGTLFLQFIRLEDRRAPLDLISPAGQEWLLKAALDPNKSQVFSGKMLSINENDTIRLTIDEASGW
jgi:hypothetical protein